MRDIQFYMTRLFPEQFLLGITVDLGSKENEDSVFEVFLGFIVVGIYIHRG